MYKLKKNVITGEINVVLKIEEGLIISIPFVNDNTDYQAYLKFLEDGGIPEPADK
jgi:Tfp pilus assembly protein PilZ